MASFLVSLALCFLLSSIASAHGPIPSDPITRASFPPSFFFGAASSSYQYEGAPAEDGKKPSNLDVFFHTHPELVADHTNGNVADDQYHRYKEDVAILKDLGFKAYRLSISWPRVLPNGNLIGGINQQGINHYNNLINELLANGIQPVVTLFHWDIPQALDDQYLSFLSPKIVDDFRDYADVCFKTFGDRVKIWLTLNEPFMVSFAYSHGRFAPGRCSNRTMCAAGNSSTEPYIVGHNQLLAHAAAVKLYKEKYQMTQKGEIGLPLSLTWNIPHTNSPADVAATARSLAFQFGWFMNPLFNGSYPIQMIDRLGNRLPTFTQEQSDIIKGSYDFIGINYYSTEYVGDRFCPVIVDWYSDCCVTTTDVRDRVSIGPKVGWINIYPEGLQQLMLYMKTTYNDPVIYITENGMMDPDWSNESLVLNDTLRVEYYKNHLTNLQKSMELGVKVKGYLAWSLLDNFEWTEGYTYRFGIVYVDYKNGLKRIPKQCALWFKSFLKPAK